ncbi:MAG: hypothetical protein A2632_02245 [Candidatus Pacebacteria bacterium RIFCSPHIGHO2_01_FULL_46_16]|nr:MAG: hypothetical protein A2632_02245 [Candidatus Pacebacteria bacterium RIFCSPHIGHO2_01_FULL_46_16]OGJ21207.1 MAG: hypothetical protein A3J60_00090 [Candidatus Pacebacteria bacterium RIFCSPHIGHO2_02_FULL_46_9]OGJ38206.1 MAG: hypothetical protein A3A82_01205 [Candidatus Pacebacteria bacterium RIFCSPLOWO2_01_FULL_47_12]
MHRGVILFTTQEQILLNHVVYKHATASKLLRQKFSDQQQDVADYELSVDDAEWLLDQLPVPQQATEIQSNIRNKLRTFLTNG